MTLLLLLLLLLPTRLLKASLHSPVMLRALAAAVVCGQVARAAQQGRDARLMPRQAGLVAHKKQERHQTQEHGVAPREPVCQPALEKAGV